MAPSVASRLGPWLERWGPVLPLLLAEATVWLGFGALLPVMPLYFTQHDTDLPTLGLVIAAWPAVRLVGEPAFGWLADRTARRPLMLAGLVVAGVGTVLPVMWVGPLAFLVSRGAAGLGAAMYDPSARGYLVTVSGRERQGEAFGLYGAAQFGGFLLGPVLGGVAAAVSGDPTVVFWVAGVSCLVAAVVLWWRLPELPRTLAEPPIEAPAAPGAAERPLPTPVDDARPQRLANRLLGAAVVLNVGSYFAGGSYEVIWSLYLTSLGAGLDLIGVSFAAFGIPVLVISPFAGRLIDRRGGFGLLVLSSVTIAVSAPLYPIIPEVWWVIVLSLVEGSAFALLTPALFSLVARATPPNRESTAQGLFGAAGTTGTIVASIAAGSAAAIDLRLPFLVAGAVVGVSLLAGLLAGGGALRAGMAPRSRDVAGVDARLDPEAAAAAGRGF